MPFLAPIIAGIGAAIGAVGTFVAGLGIFGQIAIIGLNYALNALLAPKASQTKIPSGVELDLQYGEDTARKAQCGLLGSAGHLTYANSYGQSNGTLQQLFVLSDFFTTTLDKIWINGELAEWGTVHSVKGAVLTNTEFAGKIWFKFYDGTQTTADDGLVDNSNPTGRWTVDHIGHGSSYVIMTMKYDREILTGPPQFFFEFKGAPLYDWRLDTSVGGSGAHRWNDQSTWQYSANPMVIDYNYERGFYINGDLFCGKEVQASDLPLDRWTTAANICDENVSGRLRYVCSVGLDCTLEHGANIDAILKSCGGMIVSGVDGTWPIIGTSQTAVATITDDDIIIGTPKRVQFKRSMDELVNSVSGTYPNPDNQWSPAGYETATDATTVTNDRRTRDVSLNLETVPNGIQAAQLASIYFSENRFEGTANIIVRPRWQVLEPGDWIIWDSARYGTRTWMVTDMAVVSLDGDGPRNVSLSLQERSGDIYDAVTVVLPPTPLGPGSPVYASELQDFAVTPILGVGADSILYPALRASWTAPTDPTVSGVILQWRPKDQPTVIFDRTIDVSQTVAIMVEGIVSSTTYEYRHKLVTDPARPTVETAWAEVTSLVGVGGDVIVGLGQTRDDVYGLFTTLRQGLDDLLAEIELVGGNAAQDTVDSYMKRTQVKKTIGALSAAVTKETTARIDGDTAIAEDLVLVEAKADDATATGLFKMEAVAGAGLVLSRIVMYARATLGDDFEEAGLVIEVVSDGEVVPTISSQVVINADKFVVTDGSNTSYPLVFEGGELVLQNARLGTLVFDQLSSANGKLQLRGDGTNAYLEIYS